MISANDSKLFYATSDGHLWATDETSGGVVSLTDFPVDFLSCSPNKCYFAEKTPYWQGNIWVTDGTVGGTFKLADVEFEYFTELVDVNGTVYFGNGGGLWKTNGASAGVELIIDNLTGPYNLTPAYDKLFFQSGSQFWATDGTTSGTEMVKDFGDSYLRPIILLNGNIFLEVADPYTFPPVDNNYIINDWQLYKSDGTQAGTQLIADFTDKVIYCPSPMCWAATLNVNNSMVIDGKWFFDTFDVTTNDLKSWVVTDVFFQDVNLDHWAFSSVEKIANAGITAGCSLNQYCPDDSVTRSQVAVFLEKGMHYPSAFTPPDMLPTFGDTPNHWAEDWIEALKEDGITSGCGNGNYCPNDPVSRAQMAVFLLKAKHGSSYTPPPATDVFTDVPVGYWADKWIEQLAAEGITSGCATGLYCPDDPVTRAQMAVLLVKTFSFP